MKIVINTCYGGFGISKAAAQWMAERGSEAAIKDLASDHFYGYGFTSAEGRTNPLLIECIETLGQTASSGDMSLLKVVNIEDGIDWKIEDYDGIESVHEQHQQWS